MTCKDARVGFIDIPNTSEVLRHLETCTECRLYSAALQNVIETVTPPLRITASNQFRERVMRRIVEEESREGASRMFWGTNG